MGRPKKIPITNVSTKQNNVLEDIVETLQCSCCGRVLAKKINFYQTKLDMYSGTGVFPFCKNCLKEIYESYYNSYTIDGVLHPEQRAIERICMMLNVYYSDSVFDGALKKTGYSNDDTSIISSYMKQVNMNQYCKKNYDITINEKSEQVNSIITDKEIKESIAGVYAIDDIDTQMKIEKAKKFFGNGFSPDDYVFLQDQYEDWTTRHECQTKSQEEMFKHICYTQLDIKKAKQKGLDTKDLDATFLRQLEAAKLQPKQNKGDTTSETQTFGTLIDKWETTRPIPEIDEDLRDVDKIGIYIDVFFRGHLAKMMGLKNGISKRYEQYMKKYTVSRPEYDDDEDGEALFDAIFGNSMNDD